jgi:hypothetical protein
MPRHHGGSGLISLVRGFCDEDHAREAEALYAPRIDQIDGGPRALAMAVEDVRNCAARKRAHEAGARAFFR